MCYYLGRNLFFFFQVFVVIGDYDGYVGLGVKCFKEVVIVIRGVIILVKLIVIFVRRGYWGNKIGKFYIVLCKVKYLLFIEFLFQKVLKICKGKFLFFLWDGFRFNSFVFYKEMQFFYLQFCYIMFWFR